MLAIFHKGFAHPPQELNSPECRQSKKPDDILKGFLASHPTNSFCATFASGAAIAAASGPSTPSLPLYHHRLYACLDEVHCVFAGSLSNLSPLIRQYGLSGKSTNEATLLIEAYRTLRDRGPYPADQVLKDLHGSFAFVLYDNKTGTVFSALGSDGGVALFWGIAADGSVVICDDVDVMKGSCGKSFAPFPNGCMYHSEGGLRSYERPMNKMKAVPRVDSEGTMCGAFFKVDSHAKLSAMPRVGSSADWTSWNESF